MELPESLKAALGTAGGGADAAISAVDTAVSSAVASASKLTAVAMESLNHRYEIGVAHATAAWWEVQALEDKVFEAPTTALASAIKDAPYATAVAGNDVRAPRRAGHQAHPVAYVLRADAKRRGARASGDTVGGDAEDGVGRERGGARAAARSRGRRGGGDVAREE